MARHKILLVDDEPDLVEMLAYNLSRAGFEVLTAGNGARALVLAEQERPDLILLDIMMPGLSGFAVCQHIRNHPDIGTTPIFMLSVRSDEADQLKGLELGADDYIVKPVSPKVLVGRVKAFLRRSFAEEVGDPPLQRDNLTIDRQRFQVVRGYGDDAVRLHFPRKEFELLYLLASQPGIVYSRDALLNTIWGEAPEVTPRTVDVHVRRIRKKLGDDVIETVTGVGYRFKS